MADSPQNIFFNLTKRAIKLGECCESISYTSNYTPLVPNDLVPTNYLTNLILYKEDCCGRRKEIGCVFNHPTGSPYNFDELDGDGNYVLSINVSYPEYSIDYTTELCVSAKCCEKKREKLACEVSNKMACLSCKIQSMRIVGRNTTHLEADYLKLSNIYYLLSSSNCIGKIPLSCEEVEILKCSIKKIK